jgi:hypothetical protein
MLERSQDLQLLIGDLIQPFVNPYGVEQQILSAWLSWQWEAPETVNINVIKNTLYEITWRAKIEATIIEIEDFKMHTDDLLKLGVNRKSNSPHKSATFIVNKHSE